MPAPWTASPQSSKESFRVTLKTYSKNIIGKQKSGSTGLSQPASIFNEDSSSGPVLPPSYMEISFSADKQAHELYYLYYKYTISSEEGAISRLRLGLRDALMSLSSLFIEVHTFQLWPVFSAKSLILCLLQQVYLIHAVNRNLYALPTHKLPQNYTHRGCGLIWEGFGVLSC